MCGVLGVDFPRCQWAGYSAEMACWTAKASASRTATSHIVVLVWLQVRANVVAITLDISEEEIHFQFGMGNWSSYVDQVYPSLPSLPSTWTHPVLTKLVTRQAFQLWFELHQLHLVCLSAADV